MRRPVVLVGETLANLAGPRDRSIDRGTMLDVSFAGAEVNVAIGLARLGHWVRWASVVGDDVFGDMVVRGLRGEGVDVSAVQVDPRHPTALMVKNRRPGGEPEVHYYRQGSAMSHATPETFSPDVWSNAEVLYLTGITPALSPGCRDLIAHLIDDAHARGIPIWFDPNYRRKLWSPEEFRRTVIPYLPKIDVFLVGKTEADLLVEGDYAYELGNTLLSLGPRHVILKLGSEGAQFHAQGKYFACSSTPVNHVVDPVGAGDGFGAGVLSGRLDGLNWEESLTRGAALGALVCQSYGDWEGLPSRRQLKAYTGASGEAVR